MYHREHNPPPFHAFYAGFRAEIEIASGRIVEGYLPRRAERLVREWATMHRDELLENWEIGRQAGEFRRVAPLE